MKVLIAPNALKGSLSAKEAAEVMARSLPEHWSSVRCPIADGGDGTLDCLVDATSGRLFTSIVHGPLFGQSVHARWGSLGNSDTAIIEMAEASGLRLLRHDQYSAGETTTFGVGELIVDALDEGFRTILIGLGGSATNDGGTGCMKALGVRFRDGDGSDLEFGGRHLQKLRTIDASSLDARIADASIICLADVDTIMVGHTGASFTFAGQKGATADDVRLLDDALKHYAETLLAHGYPAIATVPGSGAAGGLGGGLAAFCRARIVPGIEYILDTVGFDESLEDCDIVLTAEGMIDEQTAHGKGISGIAARAKKFNKPVYAFAGRVHGDAASLAQRLSLHSIHQFAPLSIGDHEAFARARDLLGTSVQQFAAGVTQHLASR